MLGPQNATLYWRLAMLDFKACGIIHEVGFALTPQHPMPAQVLPRYTQSGEVAPESTAAPVYVPTQNNMPQLPGCDLPYCHRPDHHFDTCCIHSIPCRLDRSLPRLQLFVFHLGVISACMAVWTSSPTYSHNRKYRRSCYLHLHFSTAPQNT